MQRTCQCELTKLTDATSVRQRQHVRMQHAVLVNYRFSTIPAIIVTFLLPHWKENLQKQRRQLQERRPSIVPHQVRCISIIV